jgi:integrase
VAGRLGCESNIGDVPSILNFAVKLYKLGRTKETIQSQIQVLKQLSKQADITKPEQVQMVIASLEWKKSTKNKAVQIYDRFLKFLGITWEKPKYTESKEIPFIPTEEEIDTLITSMRKSKLPVFIQFLKETGARLGEGANAKWENLDITRKTIYIEAEKGSNSRILPISNKLIDMLNRLPKDKETIFGASKETLRRVFGVSRNRIAERVKNPRLRKMHLHTFRHWKATMEYHKTKDIIHVKQILGHKSIESTMIYINIEGALWLSNTDEWTTIVTHNLEEETKAINSGFELVRATNETTAIYKKRK